MSNNLVLLSYTINYSIWVQNKDAFPKHLVDETTPVFATVILNLKRS